MIGVMDLDDDTTLTSATVCSRLGIDRSTLVRWVQAGRIVPAFKFPTSNGAYLFEASEVERVHQLRTAATR